MENTSNKIIEINNVSKAFKRDQHQDRLVLQNISMTLKKGEIVALLGKSGSGKSTFLRIIAGLIKPTQGEVYYRSEKIVAPTAGIAMVFQNFALLPWLTVLENVELGLEAQGVPRVERRKRAIFAIDIIGMDGFESAYPKELSGGMRQRVGFARALVINPDVLLMDEPFSALDVLTAENLRNDLLDLWQSQKIKMNCILLVTHNIEEAVYLADRIILFDANPGSIRAELPVKLEKPRNPQDPQFRAVVDKIYTLMTTQKGSAKTKDISIVHATKPITRGYRLPDADIAELTGLLETLNDDEYQGKMDLPELADYLSMDLDDLFALTEVLEILGFAQVSGGDIEATAAGKEFSQANIQDRKRIFAKHLLSNVSLAQHIRQVLDLRPGHRFPKDYFLEELEAELSDKEAERVLKITIDWGRYAELFAYDDASGMLSLENPD